MALSIESGADRAVTMCLNVTPGETVVVFSDPGGDAGAARAVADAAERAGAVARVVDVAAEILGAEADVASAPPGTMDADVLIGVTSVSLYHSAIGRLAARRGARVLAMTGCTERMLTEGAIEADFAQVEPRCVALAEALTQASRLRLTTARGTELTALLTGRAAETCTGRAVRRGDRTGFPDIEAFIAPLETTACGRLVVDGSSTSHGIVDAPISIEVDDGAARSFEGGAHAAEIEALLHGHGPAALVLAEFGFGLNPAARIIGNIIEDEATYGTGHVAFGSNVGFGGVNNAPLHQDLVYWRPTLRLDDVTVIADGELLLS
jgi:leucyl aminopeptidase (aminopeptidase T)